jgi:hypothetical protein
VRGLSLACFSKKPTKPSAPPAALAAWISASLISRVNLLGVPFLRPEPGTRLPLPGRARFSLLLLALSADFARIVVYSPSIFDDRNVGPAPAQCKTRRPHLDIGRSTDNPLLRSPRVVRSNFEIAT